MPPSPRLSALRNPAVSMAAGMVVFAGAGYVFVVLAGRVLPKDQATLATSLYFLANVVGPGVFFALEQVTSRTTSVAVVEGGHLGAVAKRSVAAGARLVAVTLLVLAALAPVLGSRTLHGDWALYAEVLATPAIAVNLHLVRGMLAGRQRFGGYSATLAAEGGSRLVLCAGVAFAGASSAWVFGLAYIGGTAFAALVGYACLRRAAHTEPAVPAATEAGAAGIHGGLAALALASLFAQLLPNLAPLVVNSRLDAGSALALTFAQAAVVARIPLLLFLPIQAMILPRLTAAAARGDLAAARRLLVRILALTVGVGAVGAAIFAATGSWALRTFFGATTDLSSAVLLGLAASTVILMATYALQPALVALGLDNVVLAGWALGSAVTGAIALLPVGAVGAATSAQIVGPLATVALFAALVTVRLFRAGGAEARVSAATPDVPVGA